MQGRGGEHDEAAETDAAEWDGTWTGEVGPEEQARAHTGGRSATAAAEEGAPARARPTRGRQGTDEAGTAPAERLGRAGGGEHSRAAETDAAGWDGTWAGKVGPEEAMPAGARPDEADTAPAGEPITERLSRGGEHGKVPDTDAVEWNDTWAGEVSPEEQARARALLGFALAGGQEATEAVEKWSRAGSGPARGEGAHRGRRRGFGNRRSMSRRDEEGAADDPGDPDGFDEPERSWGRRGRRGERGRVGSGDSTGWDHPVDEYDPDEADRPRGRRSGGGRRRSGDQGEAGRARRGPAQIDPDADPEAAARAICLRQLTGQPRTRAQLADALRRRGVPDDVAEHVLGRFTEVKLIDDAAFAAAWVDTRHVGRGLARRALARELRQRGVDPDLVHEAVERLDPEQELETARALVARKLPSTRRLDRQVRMRRLAAMLARKGYSEGLALRVVREALDADDDPLE